MAERKNCIKCGGCLPRGSRRKTHVDCKSPKGGGAGVQRVLKTISLNPDRAKKYDRLTRQYGTESPTDVFGRLLDEA